MVTFQKFHIECPAGHEGRVNDHYPLTRDEVRCLLEEARKRYDGANVLYHPSDVRSIQTRLDQAIPGMTCPRPIDGEVSDIEHQMNSFYVSWLESEVPVTEGIVDAMCGIIGLEYDPAQNPAKQVGE